MGRIKSIPLVLCTVLIAACGDDKTVCPVFESPIVAYSLGILRATYTISSPPMDFQTLSPKHTRGFQDPALIWFNPYTQFHVTDIYPREVENDSENRTDVLVLDFDPQKSILMDSVGGDPTKVWAGIMRGLPERAWDQTQAAFLELRMAVSVPGGDESDLGVLHIDLGQITEDVDLDGLLDTEDFDRNGLLEDEEDIGLDGLTDAEEVSPDGTGYDPVSNPDPAGDNWFYDSNVENEVSRINGTQGNSAELLGGRPDSEDIGSETGLDRINSYFSFRIDLADPDPGVVVQRTERTRSGLTWRTYRIPLWFPSFYTAIGNPNPSDVQFIRLWLDGADGPNRLYIAQLELIQFRDEVEPSNTDTLQVILRVAGRT